MSLLSFVEMKLISYPPTKDNLITHKIPSYFNKKLNGFLCTYGVIEIDTGAVSNEQGNDAAKYTYFEVAAFRLGRPPLVLTTSCSSATASTGAS